MQTKNNLEYKILLHLRRTLPPKRLGHVMGVARYAERLARVYGLDPIRVRLAALLHDLARAWPDKKLIDYVRRHRIRAPDLDFSIKTRPLLLHSHVGAHLAKRLFNVCDPEILSGISKHTLGSLEMSLFDKVIYVADLLAPDRKFALAARLRILAQKRIEEVYSEGVRMKLIYSASIGEPLHPYSVRVWNRLAEGKNNG